MDNLMGLVPASVAYPVSLDAKRRPTLPMALLAQVHIQPGDDLVAVPAGEGAILLQNRSAALARTRESVRAGFKSPVAEGAVDRFQQDRRADLERNDASFKARNADEASDSEAADRAAERGASLLAELGL